MHVTLAKLCDEVSSVASLQGGRWDGSCHNHVLSQLRRWLLSRTPYLLAPHQFLRLVHSGLGHLAQKLRVRSMLAWLLDCCRNLLRSESARDEAATDRTSGVELIGLVQDLLYAAIGNVAQHAAGHCAQRGR
jgi:hypothetical protein